MPETIVRDSFEILFLLLGIVTISFLVKNSAGAGQLVQSVSGSFSGLMKTATFQDNTASNFATGGLTLV